MDPFKQRAARFGLKQTPHRRTASVVNSGFDLQSVSSASLIDVPPPPPPPPEEFSAPSDANSETPVLVLKSVDNEDISTKSEAQTDSRTESHIPLAPALTVPQRETRQLPQGTVDLIDKLKAQSEQTETTNSAEPTPGLRAPTLQDLRRKLNCLDTGVPAPPKPAFTGLSSKQAAYKRLSLFASGPVCSVCSNPITDSQMLDLDGKVAHLHCMPCGANCGEPLSGDILSLPTGEMFHTTCFKCCSCSASLANGYGLHPSGDLCCPLCLDDDFGEKSDDDDQGRPASKSSAPFICRSCSCALTGDDAAVQIPNLGDTTKLYYHNSCLHCASCKTSLNNGQPVFSSKTDVYCEACAPQFVLP